MIYRPCDDTRLWDLWLHQEGDRLQFGIFVEDDEATFSEARLAALAPQL